MKTLWILVPAFVMALALPRMSAAEEGCGCKAKAGENTQAVFGAEPSGCAAAKAEGGCAKAAEGGCPHAKAEGGCAKAAEGGCPHAKADGGCAKAAEGGCACKDGKKGDCANCPKFKDGKCTCAGAKDGKACDCKDCPHKKDGTCPHTAAK